MLIADFHNDILTSEKFSALPTFYFENKIVTAIFRGSGKFTEVLSLVDKSPFIAFEDVGYDDLDEDKLISLKPVYVGLTWNGENKYGYGCDYSFGLKNRGIDFVRKLNRNKVIIDTAHISKMGFKDIIDNAEKVVNSHTLLSGVYRHKRNIEDWQVKLIIEKNGLIGLTCCAYFMPNVKGLKINGFIRNILYFSEKFGTDNFCIGTDFFGTDFLPEGLDNYNGFYLLGEKLMKEGMSKTDIEKLFFRNLCKFLADIEN